MEIWKHDTLTLKTRHTNTLTDTHGHSREHSRTHTDTHADTHVSPHRYDYVTNVISALSHRQSSDMARSQQMARVHSDLSQQMNTVRTWSFYTAINALIDVPCLVLGLLSALIPWRTPAFFSVTYVRRERHRALVCGALWVGH